jgi:putative DNA primase/helicase
MKLYYDTVVLVEMPLSRKQMQLAPLPPNRNGDSADFGVIGTFNETYDLTAILERNGYERRGNRFLAPDSTTGLPGVHVFENGRCYSHHANDPLNDGHSHDAFDVFQILEHGGEVKTAVKEAAKILGIERKKDSDADPQNREGEPKKAHNFKLVLIQKRYLVEIM